MRNEIELPRVPESGMERIGMRDFLNRVFPETIKHQELADFVIRIFSDLRPYCLELAPDIGLVIKKGAMRVFSLDNGQVQDEFNSLFENMDNSLIGYDPEVRQAVKNNFRKPMDLDVRFALDLTNSKKTDMLNHIACSLTRFGFIFPDPSNPTQMINNGYRAVIKSIPIGVTSDLTKWAVDFYELGGDRPVFKLDLAELPQTNAEYNDDIVNNRYSADTDQVLGYIYKSETGMDISYHTTDGQPDMKALLYDNYLDASSGIHHFSPDLNKYIFQSEREAAYRGLFIDPLFSEKEFTLRHFPAKVTMPLNPR